MAGSVNKVILVGNLGKDPEIRSMADGSKVCNLSLATSESWVDKNTGERKERTEWSRVVIFNDRITDVAERYLKKGAKVYVEGSLQTRKWTDQSGQERYSTEVVISRFRGEMTMLDTRGAGDGGERAPTPAPQQQRQVPLVRDARPAGGGGRDLDDEIPFAACWQ